MLKFAERLKTPGITLKKTSLSLKRISCMQVIFVIRANLNETNADMDQLIKR